MVSSRDLESLKTRCSESAGKRQRRRRRAFDVRSASGIRNFLAVCVGPLPLWASEQLVGWAGWLPGWLAACLAACLP